MPYTVIEDFKSGLDTRKMAESSLPGSLQALSNAHITRGGEIEKRKAWVSKYALPAGQTFGLAGANGQLYTFGSAAGVITPVTVTYQRLVAPGAPDMTAVNDVEFFDGKVAVSATFADGTSHVFYDGTLVTDFESGSGAAVAGRKISTFLTVKNKLYGVFSSVVAFSSVAAPTSWQSGSGYGFINMSNQSAGSEVLTGLGRYQNYLAVFARRNTQIWYVDPDPLQNDQRQVLPNIGTFAPKSIISYGDADVFFLSDTGIRSLRARDASNQANVQDVGTLIDAELTSYLQTLDDATKAKACGVVEPIDGRYIMAVGDRAYVFSYYPGSRISAWSTYDLGFEVDDFVTMDNTVWARSGDTVYLLGGDSGASYDNSVAEIRIPFIDGQQIATWKNFTGVDFVCEGEWDIYVSTDPTNPSAESQIATINGTTLNQMDIRMVGSAPIISLRLVNSSATPARMSKIIIHYDVDKAH